VPAPPDGRKNSVEGALYGGLWGLGAGKWYTGEKWGAVETKDIFGGGGLEFRR